jgi:hypothetical protein
MTYAPGRRDLGTCFRARSYRHGVTTGLRARALLLVIIPVLRPLGLLRSVRLIRAARLARVGAAVGLAVRESRLRLASRAALLTAGPAVILAATAAVMVLDAERAAPKANITGFGDAHEVRELRDQIQAQSPGRHRTRWRHMSQKGSHGHETDVPGRAVHRLSTTAHGE